MGSEKDLTATQKGAIIYGYLKKDSYRTIVANVGYKKSVVGNVIGKYRETGTTELQKNALDVHHSLPFLIALSSKLL